jgi:hypothetical protein
MQNTLANADDANLILKLYELRTEATMRKARAWMTGTFWPSTAEEVLKVMNDPGSDESHYFRQVHTYWEMAASLVLHGCLSQELFLDCNAENLFIYAKLHPLLPGIREQAPGFFTKTEEFIARFSSAQKKLEALLKNVERRRSNTPTAGNTAG